MATRRSTVLTDRRSRRADTRQRLLDATLALLEERPWSEIVLEDVTRRAEVSRTSYYRHFEDREDLLLALLAEIAPDLERTTATWYGGRGTPVERLRAAVRALTQIHVEHGRLLHAAADAATHDPAVAGVYRALAERFIAMSADAIAAAVAAGTSEVGDPEEVARALVWMNERYLLDRFGRPPLADPERSTDALVHVWLRAVYGRIEA
jgi:AcrR family transcriptional regulator